jgi:uncharacterized membrane protein
MARRIALFTALGGLGLAMLLGCTASATGTVTTPGASTAPSSAPGTKSVSFAKDVTPLLKSRCAACHSTGGGGAAKVEMFDASGSIKFDNVKANIADMIAQVKAGRMPLSGPKLTADEIGILESWQAGGTQNN